MAPIHVIKVGGAIVESPVALGSLVGQIQDLARHEQIVVVHGGGPQATRMAKQFGHTPVIVEGRRVTSAFDLEIILATVCGMVNTGLVAALNAIGVRAVGVSGASDATVKVAKRPPWKVNGSIVDFGHVGDIDSIDPSLIQILLAAGCVPVVATIGIDKAGALYNVNADTTAAAVAVALGADRLSIVTDSRGLKKGSTLVENCDPATFATGRDGGWITDGMVVKLNAGFSAITAGVSNVRLTGHDGIADGSGTKLIATRVHAEP